MTNEPAFRSEALGEHHDLEGFRCGHDDLDAWLRNTARSAGAKNTGRTFVWVDRDDHVAAYYTLCAHVIVKDEVPRKWGRGDPDQIPATLLARLALDTRHHGRGVGSALLSEALRRAVIASAEVAARYVVVHAIDKTAEDFYRHHGFRDSERPSQLLRKVSDIAADLTDGAR